MANETSIQPALTPDEWKAEQRRDEPDGSLSYALNRVPDETLAAHMALANYRLPDDDPRKLTRKHCELLMLASDRRNEAQGMAGSPFTDHPEAVACRAVAAIIAALLPPTE